MSDYPLLLTQAEAADLLGVKRDFLRELVHRGEIEVVPYRSDERIPRAELDRWVRENMRPSTRSAPTAQGIESRDKTSTDSTTAKQIHMLADVPESMQLLAEADAAELLHLGPRTLANLRWRGSGPAHVKFGRSILYRLSDLHKYLEERTVPSR